MSKFLECLNQWAASSDELGLGYSLLKLKEGTYKVRILDEFPISKDVHFESIVKRTIICPGAGCLFCARGDRISKRSYVNVLDRADNKVKVMPFSIGLKEPLSQILVEAAKQLGTSDPRMFDLVIVRTGKGQSDTRYSVALSGGIEPLSEEYTHHNLEEVLKPMPIDEMQGHLSHSAQVTTRKIRDFNQIHQSGVAERNSTENPIAVADGDDIV